MEVLHEHKKTIHAGGDPASTGKPVHTVRDSGHDLLHPRLQGGVLGLESARLHRPAAFRTLGYNPEVLGFERIHNTTKRIRREAKSLEGLREGTRGGVRLQKETTSADSPSVEAARRMRREILCLQQQMAFLKKVMRLHDKPEQ